MPIYEYLCQTCGKKFEVLQKFSDEPLHVHEECGGNVDKLISTSALQFKGSGWYVNDYAKGATGKPGETKADVKADSGGESKAEAKADSKSETKSDSKSETKSESKSESKPAATESKPAATSSSSSNSK
jgi:putative FmdB family regulatory protein